MTAQQQVIQKQLAHLEKMSEYLLFSTNRVEEILPSRIFTELNQEEHESLAAFRVRFSDFQERLSRLMRAIAIEEHVEVDRFGTVLAFMEKLEILESAERWKLIRELRNSINHEYEDNPDRLSIFFSELLKSGPMLYDAFARCKSYCKAAYAIGNV